VAATETVDVVVVGAGQAGLATSFHLTQQGVDHVVLERDRAAHAWRAQRWDSFCLVTPNWTVQLPGFAYDGPDPDGYMKRDELVKPEVVERTPEAQPSANERKKRSRGEQEPAA